MLHVVIMAGGAGTRLFPLSTPEHPKQFLNLLDPHLSLLQQTLDRLTPLLERNVLDIKNMWIVTHEKYRHFLEKQATHLDPHKWLLEPAMKNTTACIGWTALEIQKIDPDAVMLVLPADQWVNDSVLFCDDLAKGFLYIQKHPGALLTIGMKPTWPSPDYGYIQAGQHIIDNIFSINNFVEKPSKEMAQLYMKDPHYNWNGGTFMWQSNSILHEIRMHKPSIFEKLSILTEQNKYIIYPSFEKISIDYAVMEKTKNAVMLQAHFQWSDLGTFENIERVKHILKS
ncbi:MAG: mannose-1-phosphate guanylyltransferase [Deltaproteobacteria bacterium]|nr:mannose-1-phosphate guanylyltransferase [Deltaproteobacteria bacterium]